MTYGSQYLRKLYTDLIMNSPQTVSMEIPSDLGKGRITQTQIKHGIILADWWMRYRSDIEVQGPVSEGYVQIIFCLNDGISWGIAGEHRAVSMRKNESCIYTGRGETEYICYTKESDFSSRPVYVRTNDHIDAHFTTCFTSLVLIRLL